MAIAFTTLAAQKIQPGRTRREIPDTRVRGLYFVIQPSGTKSWALRYRYAGRPRKLTLGPFPAIGVSKARERAADALEVLAEGRDPGAENAAAKLRQHANLDRDSFGAVARLFIERYAKPKNRRWRESARLLGLTPDPRKPNAFIELNGGLVARWAERQIDGISRRDVIDLLDEIADRAPITANRTLAALRKLFNWAVARDILEASPCAGVKPPGQERSRDRVLTHDEIKWLWQATEAEGYPFGPLVRFLLLTGQRRQEVTGMRRSELDLTHGTWSLPRARTKNDRPHEVPLSDAALDIIESVPVFAAGDFIFSGTGRSPFSGFSRAFSRLNDRMTQLADASIPHWTLHDLRRTAATRMAGLGVAPHVIEAALNHISGSKAGVAGIYNRHSHAEEKRAALDGWAGEVQRIVNGASPTVRPSCGEN